MSGRGLRQENSVNQRIREAGWFRGTEQDWRDLPSGERERLSFEATGCEVAYPTWPRKEKPTCEHTSCRIRRGELPKIALTNGILYAEYDSGWLRFLTRSQAAKVFRAIRKQAMATGIYDPWKMEGGWQVMVQAGISGEK